MSRPAASSSRPLRGPILHRVFQAIALRRDFYEAVADDDGAWRPALAVVCLAALARDSVTLSELDFLLVLLLRTWSLLPIMLLAILRWLTCTAIAYPIARLLAGQSTDYYRLLRCLGFAQAPVFLTLLAFFVDATLVRWVPVFVMAWTLASSTVAAGAALESRVAGSLGVSTGFLASYLLFDHVMDFALFVLLDALKGGGVSVP
jgi:hypothetical protein